MAAYSEKVDAVIAHKNSELRKINSVLWNNPEVAHGEKVAHDTLTKFLEENGFQVERNFVHPTGFKATFVKTSSESGDSRFRHVCFLCEYDALPELRHAAGHNLSAVANIGTALAVKTCLEEGKLSGIQVFYKYALD